MDLSIIIVCYRGWKPLKECLDGLSVFTGGLPGFEVIIIDNNSADGVIEKFKSDYPDFIFLQNKINGGFANGCNLGSSAAKGEYLLFLNPDTIASETSVKVLLERAKKHPEYYIMSCRQEDDKGKESKAYGLFPGFGTLTGFGRAIYSLVKSRNVAGEINEMDGLMKPDWVSGSVMMIKKEIFRKIGRFDEDYWMYFEDVDICRRAREMDGEIAFFTDITIRHNHGGSSRINLSTAILTKTEVLISNHLYLSKHYQGINRTLLQSWLVFLNLLTGLVTASAGLLSFYKPKMLARTLIYGRLLSYYFTALRRGSWISARSVNYINTKTI